MPRKTTPTIAEAIDLYMRSRTHIAQSTALNDRSVLNRFVQHIGPNRRLQYLTYDDVGDFFLHISNTQAASSYNKVRQRVAGFFKYCARRGWVATDLMEDVHTITPPRIERLRLSPDELVEFLNIPGDPRDRAFVALAMNTALRSSEITFLRVGDVDLAAGELYVYRKKSKHDDRLPITPKLDSELRQWLTVYANEVAPSPLRQDDVLFPARFAPSWGYGGPENPHVVVPGNLRPSKVMTHPHRIIQRTLQDFGIEVTFQEGLHTIRRSVARAFFEDCADKGYDSALRSTASFLGHKSTVTTEIYLGLSADRRRRDAILRGGDFLPFDRADNVIPLRKAE